MGDWEDKAAHAAERKSRMMSFGTFASGVLVSAKRGNFVVDPEDCGVSWRLLMEGEYAENELSLASSFLDNDSNVLVVGPHIGALAVPLSKLCAHMDVVEANPQTQRLLEMNLSLNGCSNVTLHRFAASNAAGKLTFLLNRENSGGSKRAPLHDYVHYVYDQPERVEVDAVALDSKFGGTKFDLVFIDIEGSEYFALQGMQSILEKAEALVIEFLPHHLADIAGVSASEFVAQLEPHFDWLYVPGERALHPKAEFQSLLQKMYDNNEGHDGIYFMKHIKESWASLWGLQIPNRSANT